MKAEAPGGVFSGCDGDLPRGMKEERKNEREAKGFNTDGTGIIWLLYLLGKPQPKISIKPQ
jgi:hypothetical protein